MKKRVFLILSIIVFIFYECKVNDSVLLVISKDSGFYNEEISVDITADPGYIVRYTLDGTEPNQSSKLYNGTLHFDADSCVQTTLAKRSDLSVLKYDKLTSKYLGIAGEYVGPQNVDCLTVLRVGLFDKSGNKVKELVREYYIGEDSFEFTGIKIISIVTNPDNLVDYEKGIYITGKLFDTYIEEYVNKNGGNDKLSYGEFLSWPANYRLEGRESEQKAHVTILESDGSVLYDNFVGLKIRGKVSRAFSKKSFSIAARDEYSGATEFGVDFFNNGTNLHSIKFDGNGGPINGNDYVKQHLCTDLNYSTLEYIPCIVFLNGEYWGVYHMTEDYDKQYVHSKFAIDKSDVIIIKEGEPKEGTADDKDWYRHLFKYIEENDMSDPEQYALVSNYIDMSSCIDYYASLLYMGRETDWPNSNFAVWKTSSLKAKPYYDQKFRYMIYDLEGPECRPEFAEEEALQYSLEVRTSFASMMRNEEFSKRLIERIFEVREDKFKPQIVNELVDSYISKMSGYMEKNNQRWYPNSDDPKHDFIDGMEDIKQFFERRYEYYAPSKEIFGLYGYFEKNIDVLNRLWDADILNGSENVFYVVCAKNTNEKLEYKIVATYKDGRNVLVQDYSSNMEVIVDEDNLDYISLEVRKAGCSDILYSSVFLPEGYQ